MGSVHTFFKHETVLVYKSLVDRSACTCVLKIRGDKRFSVPSNLVTLLYTEF